MSGNNPDNRIKYLYAIMAAVALAVIAFLFNSYTSTAINSYWPGLDSYIPYISKASYMLMGILGSYIVYRILLSIFIPYEVRRAANGNVELTRLALRILFYVAAVFIVLSAAGISLSGALAGGAVGGIVLGLAVQNIATGVLAGFILSSSRTLLPGEIVLMHSWMFGTDQLCKVIKVNAVFTELITQNSQRIHIASNMLLNTTTFIRLGRTSPFTYVFPVVVNSDVEADTVRTKAEGLLASSAKKLGMPEIYLTSKTGSVNGFTVRVQFNDIEEVNGILDIVNNAFDKAYVSAKGAGTK